MRFENAANGQTANYATWPVGGAALRNSSSDLPHNSVQCCSFLAGFFLYLSDALRPVGGIGVVDEVGAAPPSVLYASTVL